MIGENGTPPTPDWSPDCRCGQTPCDKAPVTRVCIALMGDEDRDQA